MKRTKTLSVKTKNGNINVKIDINFDRYVFTKQEKEEIINDMVESIMQEISDTKYMPCRLFDIKVK